ncbi:MAG: hypothetical protein UT63_C0018G0016 [Candidatus Gottesmanbacteria bacterium GW2011_GWC2_39_8]|uniref:Uncharacterized protein n=1 Tax=Candidatus Gottesmanbacteria bacterium GW2011_GWC2_39_8 TaxID=1618450 RepID=A0A0G0Q7R7_9BACT|nr:MAG: hypothetical protein UT63_C0018G0016 [Candidatus Gottesmanbacteria bacterium GW2011_GWC2_39_8]
MRAVFLAVVAIFGKVQFILHVNFVFGRDVVLFFANGTNQSQ